MPPLVGKLLHRAAAVRGGVGAATVSSSSAAAAAGWRRSGVALLATTMRPPLPAARMDAHQCLRSQRSSSSSSSSSSSAACLVGACARPDWSQQPRRPQARCYAASGRGASGGGGGKGTVFTLPTILTLGRVAAVPAVVAAWFWSSPHATAAVTSLFVAAALTDWLDGYLARRLNASTKFGAFLDPVADKLMVAAALVLLCTRPVAAGALAGNAWLVPACTLVIIGREITMSALREWAATLGPAARDAVAVNAWGKWKTASQMVALTALLMTRDGVGPAAAATAVGGEAGAAVMQAAAQVGPPLLVVAAYLSAHSLALYLRGLWRFMAE